MSPSSPPLRARRRRVPVHEAAPAALALGLAVMLSACSAPRAADPTPSPSGRGGVVSGGGITRPTAQPSNLPQCSYPKRVPTPAWMPDDLPFPPGTYTFQDLPAAGGYQRALLVIPGDLTGLTRFVLSVWPSSGWVLGRGDSEPGEVEDQFIKAPAIGAFKAVSVYCTPGYSKMLLVFAPQNPGLPVLPSPSGSPINPTASP